MKAVSILCRHFLAALALWSLTAPAQADVLVDNIEGIRLDDEGKVDRFTGLWIDDGGHILQVLHRGDKRPQGTTYRTDGRGRIVIPGMIDAHAHVMDLGFAQLELDLSDTTSLADALTRIGAFAAAHPDRPWILGRGWNQEKWGLGRFPTAAELDQAVGDRPVLLDRVDGHAIWANSAAMEQAGITPSTKDPVGGRIERVAGSRKPAGVFVDAAMPLVRQAVPQPRPLDYDIALGEAQKLLLANGITAVADMGTDVPAWQAFRRAGDEGHLNVRIMAYAAGLDALETIAGPRPTPWLYGDKLRAGGIKLYLDGALGSRGAWLTADYADDPGNRGLPLLNPAQLRNLMSRASMDGFQVAIHAIGDAANREALLAIEELAQTYTGDRRWRIEHAQIVAPGDIPAFGRDGIIASMQPTHQTSDRLMAEARLGPDRLQGAYAWKSLADAGATLAFGSDAPVEAPDPFAGWAAAISRQDARGEPFGGWMPQERVSREAAFAAFTADAAYAGFAEGRFGRLARGERADFIVIDRDPMLASPDQLGQTKVLETWVSGEKVYSSTAQPSAGGR
ncbi:amidohydrolase family protein [Erythrobacter sp. LQ02-29]|uniref:amidohydrolase n=1 Tax=Erythrobacter sp. LQ02-29 TaxID=2920384 RepID=UPI001F4F08A1|nr:amidohydrolase [Erythrobacter sp. LQ02-29]MCP9222499.1 amidohydrolase family protein [Erythrobacter sp. LQ02-29]